ncbi:MAG: MoaD/ThiS family protein [Gemmataceae bacterium]|nr:MoaD/ThiS family protein [Gemmataceae bacterium]
MATIWIPAPLRALTQGEDRIVVAASTAREAVDALEIRFPGIRERLLHDGELRPGLALAIDQQVMRHGLDRPLQEASEVHFLPAIGGG